MNPNVAGATKSKTVWLGLLITLLGYLQANLPLIRTLLAPWLKPEQVEPALAGITMLAGMLVVVVRFLTDGPLSEK